MRVARLPSLAWGMASSPVTVKSFLMFAVLSFIVYTVIVDHQQRQQSYERYKAIAEYTEESKAALKTVAIQNQAVDKSIQASTEMLRYMEELNHSLHGIAAALAEDRKQHEADRQRTAAAKKPAAKRKKRKSGKPLCFELKPVTATYGGTEMTVYLYKRTTACK